jgi:hypothetical protein
VLIVGVVCLRKIFEARDGLQDDQRRRRAEALDALGDQDLSAVKACAEPVVEVTDHASSLMSVGRANAFAADHGIVPFFERLAVGLA